MLSGFARWLRAAGYDTASQSPQDSDRVLVARAVAEDRVILTRDRQIAEHRAAAGRVLVLHGDSLDGWAAQAAGELGIDWLYRPFSRCLVCNVGVLPAPAHLHHRVPPGSGSPITWCPCCDRLYWPGSHVRRMSATLERWRSEEWQR